MFKNKVTLVIVLLIIIIGCNRNNKKHNDIIVNQFPNTTELVGHPAYNIEKRC